MTSAGLIVTLTTACCLWDFARERLRTLPRVKGGMLFCYLYVGAVLFFYNSVVWSSWSYFASAVFWSMAYSGLETDDQKKPTSQIGLGVRRMTHS